MADQHDDRDLFDLGLQADLNMLNRTPNDRRRILKLGAVGIGMLLTGGASAFAQSRDEGPASVPLAQRPGRTATPTRTAVTRTATPTATTGTATPTATTGACMDEIPQETAGPYPADGSNASNQTLNVLNRSGIVRSDIRTSLGTGTTAAGVPLTVVLTLVDSSASCAPLAGYALYLWHCDRAGNYSLYSSGVTGEDYLRGVQVANSAGQVTFTTIFPGCYAGRWPHIHFEIYPSLALATTSSNAIHTSQLAFPEAVCDTVYATTGYSSSATNLSGITLATDNVFSDGYSKQMATLIGNVSSGYTAALTVGVDV